MSILLDAEIDLDDSKALSKLQNLYREASKTLKVPVEFTGGRGGSGSSGGNGGNGGGGGNTPTRSPSTSPASSPSASRASADKNPFAGMGNNFRSQLVNMLPGGGAISQGMQAGKAAFGGGFGGIAAGAGIGAAFAAAGAALSIFTSAVSRAGESAQTFARGVSGGGYDKLRASENNLKNVRDKNAANPAAQKWQEFTNNLQATFEGGAGTLLTVFDNVGKGINGAFKAVGDIFKPESEKKKEAATEKAAKQKELDDSKKGLSLRGDNLKDFTRLKTSRKEMEEDIGMSRASMERSIFQQQRDYAIQIRQFGIQTKRQEQAFAKQGFRMERDYTLQKQKLEEDFGFKQSQKAYQYQKQAQLRDYQTQMRYGREDFAMGRSDSLADFTRQTTYSQQDYQTQKGDTEQDYATSRKRSARDIKLNLADAMMDGADSKSVIRMMRQYKISQADQAEDFTKQQGRAERNFNTQQGRAGEEFGVQMQRGERNFGIQQGRAGEQFQTSQVDQEFQHKMDLENHEYEIKWANLELEKAHGDALEDLNTAMKQFAEDVQMQREQLKNQAEDMAFSQDMSRKQQNISEFRQRRGQDEAEGDFAKGVYNQNTAEFEKVLLGNPQMADWFNKNQLREGDNWGYDMNKIQEKANNGGYAPGAQNPLAGTNLQGLLDGLGNYFGPKGTGKDELDKAKGIAGLDKGIKFPSYDTGGYIRSTQTATVHPGEFIINPNATGDLKQRNMRLYEQLSQQMGVSTSSSRGGAGAGKSLALDSMLSSMGGMRSLKSSSTDFSPIAAGGGGTYGGGNTFNVRTGGVSIGSIGAGNSENDTRKIISLVEGISQQHGSDLETKLKQTVSNQRSGMFELQNSLVMMSRR